MITDRVHTDGSDSYGPEVYLTPFASVVDGLRVVDETVRLLTLHFGGYPIDPVGYISGGVENKDFLENRLVPYVLPHQFDFEDCKAGGVCAISGYWFPGSWLVETEFGLVGQPFAGATPEDMNA